MGEVEEGVAREDCKWESRQLQAFLSGGFGYLEPGGTGQAGVCGGGVDVLVDTTVFKDVGREGSEEGTGTVKAGWWENGGLWWCPESQRALRREN